MARPIATSPAKMTSASTTHIPLAERPLLRSVSMRPRFWPIVGKKKGRTVEGRKPCSLGGGGNEALLGGSGVLRARLTTPLYSNIRPRYDVKQSLCQRPRPPRRATKCTATIAPARPKTRFSDLKSCFRHACAVLAVPTDDRITQSGE